MFRLGVVGCPGSGRRRGRCDAGDSWAGGGAECAAGAAMQIERGVRGHLNPAERRPVPFGLVDGSRSDRPASSITRWTAGGPGITRKAIPSASHAAVQVRRRCTPVESRKHTSRRSNTRLEKRTAHNSASSAWTIGTVASGMHFAAKRLDLRAGERHRRSPRTRMSQGRPEGQFLGRHGRQESRLTRPPP